MVARSQADDQACAAAVCAAAPPGVRGPRVP